MTELEERLRSAFRTRAEDIPDVAPELDLPDGGRDSVVRRGADRVRALGRKRWLAPAGAAIAVLGVVGGLFAASGAAPRSTPATAPIQLTVPRYYVALDSNRPPSSYPEPLAYATLRETATGAVLARIKPPTPYDTFVAVSGAADDRTFVLLAMGRTDPFTQITPERFFLLQIDPTASSPAGRVQLTALPASDIPGGSTARYALLGNQVDTMALSPNGTELAALLSLTASSRQATEVTYLYVYNLATGSVRTWLRKCAKCQLGDDLAYREEDPDLATLSWAASGKSLAFMVGTALYPGQLRLLDLSAPGDNVQPNSTPFDIRSPAATWNQVVMTPDGKSVFFSFNFTRGSPPRPAVSASLLRFSVATGGLTRINTVPLILRGGHAGGYSDSPPLLADTILWTNYNGSKIIVADAAPGHTAGVYSNGTYTPLQWPANAIGAAW
jgi:hypothetical protein